MVKIKKLTLIQNYLVIYRSSSNFPSYTIYMKKIPDHKLCLDVHLFLQSCNVEQFLILSFVFYSLSIFDE